MGETHQFPSTWNDKQIGDALLMHVGQSSATETIDKPDTSSQVRTERTNVGAVTEYEIEGELFPELPQLNLNQKMFVDTIAEIETGGLENKEIRTMVTPSSGGSGSSAYGRYQITHGLLSATINQSPEMFEAAELNAANELIERQEIALAIGGRDKKTYAKGGSKYYLGKRWAKKYGYEDVDAFLDAFDYGGDFGLSDNEEFQTLYEGFARKMLIKQLKDAGNDPLEAAAQWHGGMNWKKSKQHRKKTEHYQKKYERILASRTKEVEG